MNILFTDGVTSIFAFLSDSDWLHAGCTSRRFLNIAHSSRRHLILIAPPKPVQEKWKLEYQKQRQRRRIEPSEEQQEHTENGMTRLGVYMHTLLQKAMPQQMSAQITPATSSTGSRSNNFTVNSTKPTGPPIVYPTLHPSHQALYFNHLTSIELPLEKESHALQPGTFVKLMSCIPTLRTLQCALSTQPSEGSHWYFEKYARLKQHSTLTSLKLQCVQHTMMPSDYPWLIDSLCTQSQLTQLHLSYFPRGDRDLTGFALKLTNLRDFTFSQDIHESIPRIHDFPPPVRAGRTDHDKELLKYFLLMIHAASVEKSDHTSADSSSSSADNDSPCRLSSMCLWASAYKSRGRYININALKTILGAEKERYEQWYRALLVDPKSEIQGTGPSTEPVSLSDVVVWGSLGNPF